MSEYVDTILIEANRKSSPQFLAGNLSNPNEWTNDAGSGIPLNIGDKISLHSSYISEIGNEASTMEIKGTSFPYTHSASNTTVVKTQNQVAWGDISYTFTSEDVHTQLKQNELTLTHSYYKTTNADGYYFALPRGGSWDDTNFFKTAPSLWYDTNSSANGSLVGTKYYYKPDYQTAFYYTGTSGVRLLEASEAQNATAQRFEIINDGSRYTLFVQKNIFNYSGGGSIDERRDPALYDYLWYKKTNTYSLPVGFNSPDNIATNITNQLSNIEELTNENARDPQDNLTDASDKQSNFSLKGQSKTNELFPCATGWGTGSQTIREFHGYEPEELVVTGTLNIGSAPKDTNIIVAKADYDLITKFGWEVIAVPPASGGRTEASELIGAIIVDKAYDAVSTNYRLYFDRTLDTGGNVLGAFTLTQLELFVNYQSSYSTIGVKRPDLYEKGKLINVDLSGANKALDNSWKVINGVGLVGDGIYHHPLSSLTNKLPNVLTTSLEWTDDNLLKLKNYFETQKSHPELFSYESMSASLQSYISGATEAEKISNITIDRTRFLHMNNNNLYEETVSYVSGGVINTNTVRVTAAAAVITIIVTFGPGWFYSNTEVDDQPLPNGTIITKITSVNATTIDLTLSEDFNLSIGGGGFDFDFTNRKVGNDKYSTKTALSPLVSEGAIPLFFDFNSARENVNTGDGNTYEHLRYGFGVKVSVDGTDYIGYRFDTNVNGMSTAWFPDAGTTMNLETTAKSIGFDQHFNSYGNAFINLTNGYAGVYGSPYNGSGGGIGTPAALEYLTTYLPRIQDGGITKAAGTERPIAPLKFLSTKLINEIYIGANNPLFQFNPKNSRFEFSLLHTPEVIEQETGIITATVDVGTPVYKINKVMTQNTYSPSFIPYSYNFSGTEIFLDENIIPYSIMDAHSGIFIEDYGVNEKFWSDSVWNLLGYSYEQFHRTNATRLARVTAAGLQSSIATTNALIQTSDLENFKVNQHNFIIPDPLGNNYPQYKVATQTWPVDLDTLALGGWNEFREISQSAISVAITADNLPRKMLSPIYLIRSDILSNSYIGGKDGVSSLPIIGICSKDNGYGDYYNQTAEGQVFTVTIPKTIQNITTTVTDPDGSPSRVDDGCLVIYKIQRIRQDNSQLANEILKQQKSKK